MGAVLGTYNYSRVAGIATGGPGAMAAGVYVKRVVITKFVATAVIRLRDGDPTTGTIVAEWTMAAGAESLGNFDFDVHLKSGASIQIITAAAEATLIWA